MSLHLKPPPVVSTTATPSVPSSTSSFLLESKIADRFLGIIARSAWESNGWRRIIADWERIFADGAGLKRPGRAIRRGQALGAAQGWSYHTELAGVVVFW